MTRHVSITSVVHPAASARVALSFLGSSRVATISFLLYSFVQGLATLIERNFIFFKISAHSRMRTPYERNFFYLSGVANPGQGQIKKKSLSLLFPYALSLSPPPPPGTLTQTTPSKMRLTATTSSSNSRAVAAGLRWRAGRRR